LNGARIEVDRLNAKFERLTALVAHSQKELEKQKTSLETISDKECPVCKQVLPDRTQERLQKTAGFSIVELKAQLAESLQGVNKVQELRTQALRTYEEITKASDQCLRNVSSLESEVEERQQDVRRLLKSSKSSERVEVLREQLEVKSQEIVKLQSRMDELSLGMTKAQSDREYTAWWVDGFQRLRLDVLRRSVVYLSDRLSKYCHDLSGGTLNAKVSLDEKKISGGAGLAVKLTASTLGGTYMESSGGEKDRIDLALAFALHDLALQTVGFSSNILVCDEVGGFIDPPGVARAVSLLKKKAESLDAVFVISQNPTWKHHIDTVIQVRRKSGAAVMVRGKA
jgi:chromosome segregation ATPase